MAYFAELDEKNTVLSILAVHNNELLVDGIENEQKGIDFCNTIKQAKWVRTSFTGSFRKRYANVGFTYNEIADIFVAPQPFASWSLDSNYDWQAPIDYPADGKHYSWNEDEQDWVEVPAV